VLGLKGNHEILHEDVKLYFDAHTIKDKTITHEKDHGRGEIREYYLVTEIDWMWQKPEWAGLAAIGMVKTRTLMPTEQEKTIRLKTSL